MKRVKLPSRQDKERRRAGTTAPWGLALALAVALAMPPTKVFGLGVGHQREDQAAEWDHGGGIMDQGWWMARTAEFQKHGDDVSALRCATACVRLLPRSSVCRTQTGSLLGLAFGRDHQALVHFWRAAQENPQLMTLTNLGLAYSRLYLNDLAGDAYHKAQQHRETEASMWGDALFRMAEARQVVCGGWDTFWERADEVARVAISLATSEGGHTISPFLAMSLPLPPSLYLTIVRAHATRALSSASLERSVVLSSPSAPPLSFPLPPGTPVTPRPRLRIAYLAAHFSPNRFMNGFLKGVWAAHDTTKVEVTMFAWNGRHDADTDDEAAWPRSQVERFESLKGSTDLGVAFAVNAAAPDVLIEMVGWYPECRPGIVAHRPARVQVLYRFIGSGGGRGDDLYVTDTRSMPPEVRAHADEKLVMLQPLYLACSHASSFPRPAATRPGPYERRMEARRALGLDPSAVYLGALNKFYKVTPPLFDAWAAVLRGTPRSQLVFIRYMHYPEAEPHLKREAEARGVSGDRLVFVPEGSHRQFLTVGAAMDVFLDTGHPISNGHTTVADMLWMEVPVVTYAGPWKASRVASSLSLASGCSAVIARDLDDYVAIAMRAARGGLAKCSSEAGGGMRAYHPEYFAHRWIRALRQAAEEPLMHHVILEERVAACGAF